MEEFLTSVFDAAATAVQFFLALWRQIVSWARDSLSEWIKGNLSPSFQKATEDALVVIDRVKSPVISLVKKAWRELRKFLAESILTFEKKFLNGKARWFRRWSTKMYSIVKPKPTKVEITTEEEIPYEDLPADVREAFLREGKNQFTVDFVEGRDKELEQYAY